MTREQMEEKIMQTRQEIKKAGPAEAPEPDAGPGGTV